MGFIRRHWAGDYPLGRAYWVNAFLLAGLAPAIAIQFANTWIEDVELRPAAIVFLTSVATVSVLYLWGVVGAWRSARRHAARGGRPLWARAAQLLLVLGVVATAARLFQSVPLIKEHAQIALGLDGIGTYQLQLAPDAGALLFRGVLREGAARAVDEALRRSATVRTLVLDSAGGRIGEGRRMGRLVKARQLNTYVEGECVSACTLVFLAGTERAATPTAKIGFHSGSLAGASSPEATRSMARQYRESGITQAFIERIQATAADDMWYPERAVLIREGVITRTSFGGETTMAASLMRDRAEVERLLAGQAAFATMRERFPAHFARAVDAMWKAKQAGASDAELFAAPRKIMGKLIVRLLPGMDDETVREFGELTLMQLKEAYRHGTQGCLVFVGKAKGVPQALLSEQSIAREQAFTEKVLARSRGPDAGMTAAQRERTDEPTGDPALGAAVAAASTRMPAGTLQRISDDTLWKRDPQQYCDSLTAFYSGVLATPDPQRSTVIRGLFSAGASDGET
jgi:hypothetical protein